MNKIAELARGYLPTNAWLQSRLTSNVNLNQTCNAFWSPAAGTINFYRSGGGCRNTGEIAGVFEERPGTWGAKRRPIRVAADRPRERLQATH